MTEESRPSTGALRKGRFSQVGSRYFITTCTWKRVKLLTRKDTYQSIFNELKCIEQHAELIALVVMPDHVHFILRLLEGELSHAVQIFKSKSAITINRKLNRTGPLWQPGFFDHKFKGDEELAPILNYMWNNPTVPGKNFRCRKQEWLWFKSMVSKDVSYPKWLKKHPMGV